MNAKTLGNLRLYNLTKPLSSSYNREWHCHTCRRICVVSTETARNVWNRGLTMRCPIHHENLIGGSITAAPESGIFEEAL